MQGRDIAPLCFAAAPPVWRDEFFYERATSQNTSFIPSFLALVRRDWKYFLWPDFNTEQLFALRADPLEEHDLIADPAQKDRLAEMRARFAELKAAAR
jgi:arylsulfatase A-like enzyme